MRYQFNKLTETQEAHCIFSHTHQERLSTAEVLPIDV